MANTSKLTFSSSPPPPPPPVIPSGPGGSSGGKGKWNQIARLTVIPSGPGDGESRKKGQRESRSGQKRKLGQMGAPKSDHSCPVCAKKFGSWKAVYGHMRVHPERDWRGAFPPSKGDVTSGFPIWDQQVPVIGDQPVPPEDPSVTVAQILLEMRTGVCNVSGHGVFGTNIGLNKEPEGAAGGSSPPPHGGDRGFDLNLPPSPEKDDKN